MILYAVTNGYLDEIPVDKILAFEADFRTYMETNQKAVCEAIAATKELDEKNEEILKKSIEEFRQGFSI
jgi:F-type H+-transporting ATPase subunit alpha